MINLIKKLFGMGDKTDFKELVKQGALIVDVRSKEEFTSGHIKGAVNIPLPSLSDKLNELKAKNQTIITCCASGMRSSSACQQLKSQGLTSVYNGGGWSSLQEKITK